MFKKISVTANQWLPLVEVSPDVKSVLAYLRRLRADGYAVVGLEQTAHSVKLQHAQFNEKVGAPARAFVVFTQFCVAYRLCLCWVRRKKVYHLKLLSAWICASKFRSKASSGVCHRKAWACKRLTHLRRCSGPRSLNVHVSGAILLWEYTRQRLLLA